MAKNIGRADRVVRVVVAIAIVLLIYFAPLVGEAAIIAGIIAAYLLITGLLSRCVFYDMVGIDTSFANQPYSTTDDRAGF